MGDRSRWWKAPLVALLLVAGCGDSTGTTDATAGDASHTAAPTGVAAATSTEDLARASLLVPEDLDGDWGDLSERFLFPNDVALARTVASCADIAEVVFDGGSAHGDGVSGVLRHFNNPVFLYNVVFPAEADAVAMMDAITSPAFDRCWADFNVAAVKVMPLGITDATYEPEPPPNLAVTADQVAVKFLVGEAVTAGGPFQDTCVCVFARVGRGIVEVHATELTLTPDERVAVVQAAVDKLAEVLAAAA